MNKDSWNNLTLHLFHLANYQTSTQAYEGYEIQITVFFNAKYITIIMAPQIHAWIDKEKMEKKTVALTTSHTWAQKHILHKQTPVHAQTLNFFYRKTKWRALTIL